MIKKYDVRAKEYVVCPFCNANILKIVGDTFTEIFVSPENCFQPNPYPIIPFDYNNMVRDTPTFRLHIQYISCPYCSKTSYKIYDFDRNKWINIYPESTVKYFSNSVPKEIYNDYAQACAILTASPSASATLSRRCLQRMIRDRWNIECSLLKNEINKIDKNDISKIERKALHAVKDIGNIGAHPNEILDVTFEDAELSIKIIEIFLQKWYIDEPAEQKLLSEAIQNNNEKQSHKKCSTQ